MVHLPQGCEKKSLFGLGEQLMHRLEDISENVHHGYFVDLFVRASNAVAVNMYKKMGYVMGRLSLSPGRQTKADVR